jgi:peptidyl-prolyl cis-trans isomerase D
MIGGIRKFAKSKWAAVLLFIPLIISFGIFGFQDPFRGISGGGFVRIGDREIHARDVSEELTAAIEEVRVQENRVISQADAIREGIATRVLSQLVYRNAVLAYADKIGVRASPEGVKDLLLNRADAFKDALGRFNLDTIRARAQQQNMTLKQFEEAVRDDLTAAYVTSAAFNAIKVPDILSLPVINYVGESRTFTVARLSAKTVPEPKIPTDAELETWYNAHKEAFGQPERRRVSVLSYSPEDFIDQVELTDAQVKAEYEKNIRDYSTPETRVISEFSAADRNTVQAFIDLAKQGVPVDEAVTRTPGLTRKDVTAKPDEISHEQYRQLAFSLTAGQVHGSVIQLDGTSPWFAVMVKTITPGIAEPFEKVAEKVRRDLAMPEAKRLYEDESEKFRDAAGGLPLEDIGKDFGFPVIQLPAVDKGGRTIRGQQVQTLVNNPALAELFTLQPGQMTNLFEGDDQRAMYRLDEIVAPFTRPFADVKDTVKLQYMLEQRDIAATKATNDMVAAVKGGQSFEQAAAAFKMTYIPSFAITRMEGQKMDPAVLQGAFDLKAGDTAVVNGRNKEPWVVRVDKIDPVTPQAAAALRAQIGQQVAETLQQDIREVFVRGLEKQVEIKQDDAAIKQYFDSYTKTEGQ